MRPDYSPSLFKAGASSLPSSTQFSNGVTLGAMGGSGGVLVAGSVPVSSSVVVHAGAATAVPMHLNAATPGLRVAPTSTPAESQVAAGVSFSLGKK